MNTALIFAYMATVLLLIATPGPVVALVVDTASRAGPKKAMITALGTHWGSLVLIAVAACLIKGSVTLAPPLLSLLSLLGCLFIAWTGLQALRSATRSPSLDTLPASETCGGARRGFMLGISNPKDIIFFMAFLPQFLHITSSLETSLAVLALLWAVIDLLVLGVWILIAGTLARRTGSYLISLCSGIALLLIAATGLTYNLYELIS